MKMLLILSAVAIATTSALSYQEDIVAKVKESGASWEAGVNFHAEANEEYFKSMSGSLNIDRHLAPYKTRCSADCEAEQNGYGMDDHSNQYPKNFDARLKWPDCPSIGHVHDQGNCKADYAISVTSAISDRICIATNGTIKTTISAQQVVSCCNDCGRGCKGGFPQAVWKFMERRGIASGGAYGSNEGCQPYLKEPTGFTPNQQFGVKSFKTPKCKKVCYNPHFGKSKVREDLHKGKSAEKFCCCGIKPEMIANGPITTTMLLFEDFLTYKSGIYRHVYGKRLGHISVKIIGYGVEDKEEYWLAVNSWSEKWGDKGVFKILKEKNHCEFDFYFYGGYPDIPKSN